MKKERKKMTHEEFRKKVEKWGWLCKILPHDFIPVENEVVSGCALCLRCGIATSAEEAGLPFDEHALDNVIR